MTSHDKERIHRWITQADLERMLDESYCRGFYDGSDAMRKEAAKVAVSYSTGKVASEAIAQCDHPHFSGEKS